MTERAQSHVVGVVLLLGLTAIAMGGLTATIGTIVDDQTASADATRVADDLDAALRPVETTGHRSATVSFADGTLGVEDRELRVLDSSGVVATVETDAVVFESEQRRVGAVAGAITRGRGDNTWLRATPPITSGPDVLVVGAQRLNGSGSVGGTGGVTTTLRTNVTHDRQALGSGEYRVAIETATPGAFERFARERGLDATVRDLDGDGVPSAVIEFEGTRTAYLVVHDMRLEVGT
ncbi:MULTISPECIES: DUF7289 family protein [Halomicrobium]|uniref:Type IV pilin n=2 Tax=Halomicrobium mukohataei TaxID=57705 RepID=C7NWC5_HALMD|nr:MULTISPECIES: hypothetical protein [Halomicrobium]ACV46266.1 conserved hypothetical protein [Halomicrobium mukohataei DSM 12286]QCD64827.1 type IV pilin [Halomicrobium mukohataei]QFR19634.1 type IV pilin [Halomicrobium sp. ZPS1]